MDEIEEVVEGIFRFAGITVRTIHHDVDNRIMVLQRFLI